MYHKSTPWQPRAAAADYLDHARFLASLSFDQHISGWRDGRVEYTRAQAFELLSLACICREHARALPR